MSQKRTVKFPNSFPSPDEVFIIGNKYSLNRGTPGSIATYIFTLDDIRVSLSDDCDSLIMRLYPLENTVTIAKKNIDSAKVVHNIRYFEYSIPVLTHFSVWGVEKTWEIIRNSLLNEGRV